MVSPERLARYAKLLRGSLEDFALPEGATIEAKPNDLYQSRRLSRSLERQSGDRTAKEQNATSRREGGFDKIFLASSLGEDDLLAELIDGPPKHICILGEGGIGKSTLLKNLALRLAEHLISEPTGPHLRVPMLVDLKVWTRSQSRVGHDTTGKERLHGLIYGAAKQLVEPGEELLSQEELLDLCRGGVLVVLLDGLDEVRDSSARQELVHAIYLSIATEASLSKCSAILSSRPEVMYGLHLGGPLRIAQHNLDPLDDLDAVARYITSYFGTGSERSTQLLRWLKQASPQLHHILRRPLFLSLLCVINQGRNVQLPVTPADLLERGIHVLYNRRINEHTEAGLELLGELANMSIEHGAVNRRTAVARTIALCKTNELIGAAFAPGDIEALLEQLATQSGILIPDRDGFGFAHQVYADYLAGRHLANRAKAQPDEFLRNVQERAWRPEWQEALGWMAAVLWRTDRPLARDLVGWIFAHVEADRDDIAGTLAMLACRMLAGAGGSSDAKEKGFEQRVLSAAMNAWCWMSLHLNISAIEAGSNHLTSLPSSGLQFVTKRVLDWHSNYMERTPWCFVHPARSRPLYVDYCSATIRIAHLLTRMDKSSWPIMRSLVTIIYDSYARQVWDPATIALRDLVRVTDKDTLVNLVAIFRHDLDSTIWERVAYALSEDKETSRDASLILVNVLANPKAAGCWSEAAAALAKLGIRSTDVLAALAHISRTPDAEKACVTAASVLAEFGEARSDVVAALVGALKDPVGGTSRLYAVRALKEHGLVPDEVLSALKVLVGDSTAGEARSAAAELLGSIGKARDDVLTALLEMARACDGDDRNAAIGALGQLRVARKDVVMFLRRILLEGGGARIAAAGALCLLRAVEDEVISESTQGLKTAGTIGAQLSWVRTLGALGLLTDDMIKSLVAIIRNSELEVHERINAIQILADLKITHPDAIASLIDILRDETSSSYWLNVCCALADLKVATDEAAMIIVGKLRGSCESRWWRDAAWTLPLLDPLPDCANAVIVEEFERRDLGDDNWHDRMAWVLEECGSHAAVSALAQRGYTIEAARSCEGCAFTVFSDRAVRNWLDLRLDLRLLPAELAALLGVSRQADGAEEPSPKEAAIIEQPGVSVIGQQAATWPAFSVRPDILEALGLSVAIKDWEKLGKKHQEAERKVQQYCFVEHLDEFQRFADQVGKAEEGRGEYDPEEARRVFGRNNLARILGINPTTLISTWTWRIPLAGRLRLGRKSKGKETSFEATIATEGTDEHAEASAIALEVRKRIERMRSDRLILQDYADALTKQLDNATTRDAIDKIQQILDVCDRPGHASYTE